MLAFWAIFRVDPTISKVSDYISFYRPVAENLLSGHGLWMGATFATRYPPGYPTILAITYALADLAGISHASGTVILTLVCTGINAVAIFRIARLFWNLRGSLMVVALWGTYPFALWITQEPYSELPYLTVYLLAILCCATAFKRSKTRLRQSEYFYFLLGGLLFGLSALIRPSGFGIGFIAAGMIFIGLKHSIRQRIAVLLFILMGYLLLVLPWHMSVLANTGKLIFFSSGGIPSIRDGLTFAVAEKGRASLQLPSTVIAFQRELLANYDELTSLGAINHIVLEKLRTEPSTVLLFGAIKAARSWYGTDSGQLDNMILLVQLPYLGLSAVASFRCWRRKTMSRLAFLSLWLVILYFWGTTIVVLSILRYMLPAIAALFLIVPGAFPSSTSTENAMRLDKSP